MTQQPPTPPPPPAGNTGAPPPGWAPASLSASGQASYADQTAASTPAPPTDPRSAIDRFTPKRSKMPLLVALIGAMIAAVVVYTATQSAQPTTSPTATATKSATTSATPTDGTPFTAGSTTGVWKIVNHEWSSSGLDIQLKVTVDSGDMDCDFDAMSQSGDEFVYAKSSGKTPNFPIRGSLSSGETATGWTHFQITRGKVLVFMSVSGNAQVSAIEVAG
jgi:hypothetical protein